ncbi:MAG TPA: response regulator transcription factor [Gaiellaceae bacterium]|jgi:DNA-binding NarL/FixJ family response regulator
MIRVLIVDDHGVVRSGLRSRLAAEEDVEAVGEAESVERAVVKARALRPDLILLDLVMSRTSGYEAIPRLAEVSPQSKILVCSALTGASSVRQALLAGAEGYVAKQASDTDLLAAIRRVAAGESYVDPALGVKLVTRAIAELDAISERERDVLHLLALGYTNGEIAKKLFISVRTVDTHRAHIMRKLELATRAELVLYALANGLIAAN